MSERILSVLVELRVSGASNAQVTVQQAAKVKAHKKYRQLPPNASFPNYQNYEAVLDHCWPRP